MKKTLFLIATMSACVVSAMAADIVAFPGAQGWGRWAKGARASAAPTVYHVTNLNDSGSGSLRDAVSSPNRIVVFDVSGVIVLKSRMTFAANLYVAGQTAPGEGITVYGNGVSFSGASNIICRYLRVRMGHGGDSGKDCAGIASGTNMIFDHCSFSWGLDENFSINPDGKGELHNITLQNTIIGQGLMTHSAGGLMQADSITLYRNLYIDNSTRNNKIKGINQYANNVVYNWSNGCYIMGGDSEGKSFVNIENNLFINGPSGGGNCFGGANADFHCYGIDNWQDANKDGVYNPAEVTNYSASTRESEPYDYPVLELYPGNQLIEKNIPTVGASLPYRDQSDCYMIDELMSFGKRGALITYETSLAIGAPDTWAWWKGSKPADTDGDGMPDAWEEANGTDKNKADATVKAANGYLNIENYINSIGVDDRQFFLRRPITLGLSYATTSTITVEWRDYTYAEEGFAVEVQKEGVWVEAGRAAAGATSYTIAGLADGQNYQIRVRAFAQHEGQEVYSEYAEGTFQTRPIEVGIVDVDSYVADVENQTTVQAGQKLLLHTDETLQYALEADIEPSAVVATGQGVITVSGSAINGDTCSMNKAGEGTLVLGNLNGYKGATVLHNGVIEFNTLKNGDEPSAIGASRSFAQNWIWDGGIYRYTGVSTSTDRNAKLTNASTFEIANASAIVKPTGVFEGKGDLTLDGAGTLQVANASFFGYDGKTILKGGKLYLADTENACKVVGNYVKQFVLAGGTMHFYSKNEDYQTYQFPIEVMDGTRSCIIPATHCYFRSKFTGNGDVEFQVPYLRTYIKADFSEFTGKIFAKGTNANGQAIFMNEGSWNIPQTRVNLSGTVYMTAWTTNATNYVGGLSGDAGTYLIGSSKNTKGHTCSWTVGSANSDETFNGIINNLPAGLNKAYNGIISITKVGTGLWRLTGKNEYAGTTTVNGGELIVNGSHTGGAAYTVNADATLKGTGSIGSAVLLNNGATLSSGDTLVTNKALTIAGTLKANSGAMIEVPVSYYGVAAKSNHFALGNVTLGDSVVLKLDLTHVEGALPEGTAITVFSAFSKIDGRFKTIVPAVPAEGMKWDLSRLYIDGKIYVRDASFNADDVSYEERSLFKAEALDANGYYWFNAANEATTNQMLSDGVLAFDATGKAVSAPTYAPTAGTSAHTGGLKMTGTSAEVIFHAPGKLMSAKFDFYRAGTADMSGSVYASEDGESYTKIGSISGSPKTEVYLDFSEALSGKNYTFLKINNLTTAVLYIQGAAITCETMVTGLESVQMGQAAAEAPVYDLQGNRVSRMAEGQIYVVEGKKVMQK